MTDVGAVNVDLRLRLVQFQKSLSRAIENIARVGEEMEESFGKRPRREIQKTQDKFQRFTWAARGYIKDTSKIVTGILISQGFYQLLNTIEHATESLFKFNNQMQEAAISFSLLLGSRQEAEGFLSVLEDFSSANTLLFSQSQQIARQLMALGIAAERVIPTMRVLADAAAVRGGGPEVIEGIARALGQIKTKGKVEMEELMQLAERGIPAMEILREELGLTGKELSKIGELRLPASKVVPALLRGMEKRFSGAAKQISRTTGGLLTIIRDNLLSIGNVMFSPVFETARKRLEAIADRLLKLRKIAKSTGIGGLFEELVPPRLRGTVMSVMGALKSLVDSVIMLKDAIKPLLSAIGELIMRTSGLVLPILAGVVRALASLAKWATSSTPLIRALAGAIGALVITTVVARGVASLTMTIKALAVAGPVARLVKLLAQSILYLHRTMLKNPITGLVTLAAAALLGLALSSRTASRWLDRIMRQMQQLLGLDMQSVLEPEDPEEMQKWLDKYNKGLKEAYGNMEDTGDAAEDAGKKVEDKFLASFDEVYEVPEKLDDVGDAIGNVGDNINMPDLPSLPNLEDGTTPEIDTSRTGGMIDSLIEKLRDAIKKLQDATENFPPLIIPPPRFAPPLTVLVEDLAAFFESLQIMWAEATAGVRERVRQFGQATAGVRERVRQFGQAFNGALQPVRNWYREVEGVFNKLGETVGRGIQTAIDWVILFPARVSEAFSGVSTSIGQHIAEAVNWLEQLPAAAWQVLQQAGMVIQPGLQTIAQFFEDHKGVIIGIFAALGVAIVLFFTNLPASIVGAATAFVVFVGSMFTNARLAAASQLEQTKNTVKSKWEEIKTGITTRLQEIYNNIIQWLADLGTSMSTKWGEIKTDITTKWEEIKAAADTKWEEIKTTIFAWVEDTIKTITDKWEGFETTLRDIWESIRITADDYWSSIKDTIKAQVNQIIAFVNKFIDYWNSIEIKVPRIKIPFVGTVGGYTISVPQIPKIPFLAEGGIITRDQIIRVAEDSHPEGVIPLSSSRARPFAEMIADAIAAVIPQQTVSSEPSLPPLYVGTLIADDRGIKELYRRMEIIRIQEIQRRGGKP